MGACMQEKKIQFKRFFKLETQFEKKEEKGKEDKGKRVPI